MERQINSKIILDLCGGSGSWSYPYKQNGYEVINVTLPKYDVRTFIPPNNVYGILAAPPCTEFSIAKNKWARDLNGGLEIVTACLRIIEQCSPVFWALENPTGELQKHIGKAVFSFQPWEFGDGWCKRTLLWGSFNRPKKKYHSFNDCPKIEGLYIRPNRKTPSLAFNHLSHKKLIRALDPFEADSDASFRAITSPAFAQSFFNANP